jgi:membrane protease YdiL (CAAX protease family)
MLPEEKRWQPRLVLMLGALVMLGMAGGIIAAMFATTFLRGRIDPTTSQMITLVLAVAGFQGLALVWVNEFLKQHQVSWGEGFGFNRGNTAHAVTAALLALPVALLGQIILGGASQWLLTKLAELTGWEALRPQLQSAVTLLQHEWPLHLVIMQGLLVVVLVPFAEEVLFRGVLYTAIRQRGRRRLALWTSALLFAVCHLYPVGFFAFILLGLLLVAVYERTKNLLAPIVLHMLFNGINFALIVSRPYWPAWTQEMFKQ